MRGRLFALVDYFLPPAVRSGSADLRAQARFTASICLIGVTVAVLTIPLNLAIGNDLWVAAGGGLSCLALLAVIRRFGWVELVSVTIMLLIVTLGVGVSLAVDSFSTSRVAWILLLGLSPLMSRLVGVYLGLFVVGLTAAAVLPTHASDQVDPMLPAVVFSVVVLAWMTVRIMVPIHHQAEAEVGAEIAAHRAKEDALHASTEVLRDEAREALTFLTRVGHELRTPLNGVIGLVHVIDSHPDSEPTRAELDAIQRASWTILQTLEALIHLARLVADGAAPRAAVDLPAVVTDAAQRALERVAPEAPRPAISLGALPRVVTLDEAALRSSLMQVMLALVSSPGGATIEGRWSEDTLSLRVRGRVACPADGAGDALRRLEDRLGLARGIARASGGDLSVEAQAERVMVTLALPARPEADPTVAEGPERAHPAPDGPGPSRDAPPPPCSKAVLAT